MTITSWNRRALIGTTLAFGLILTLTDSGDAVRDERYFEGDWSSYTSVRYVNSAVLTDDFLYLGTRGGIARYDRLSDSWLTPLTISDGLLANNVSRLGWDRLTDELYAETQLGTSVYNRLTRQWTRVLDFPQGLEQPWEPIDMTRYFLPFGYSSIDPGSVEDLNRRSYAVLGSLEDERGVRWIGTWGGFVWTVEFNALNANPVRYGLYQDAVAAIYLDSRGMYFGGPASIDGERGMTEYDLRSHEWNYYEARYVEGFNSDEITDIAGRPNGRYLYMATDQGVVEFDRRNKSFTTIDHRDRLTDDRVWSLCLDGEILWIGTETGIDGYHIPTDSIFHASTDLLHNSRVYDIDVTDDVVWLGTDDGLYRLAKPTPLWRRFSFGNGPLAGRVRALTHDADHLYAGTDRGIAIVDLHGLQPTEVYESPSVLPDGNIYAIAVTDSIIWASTQSGLLRFVPATLERRIFDDSDGLLDVYVEDIIVDGDYLWLATFRGASRFRWNNPLRID